MIIQTDKFQEACRKILDAVDNTTDTEVSTSLELVAQGNVLNLNVTNKEYYVTVKLPLTVEEDFHAVVNAKLFLTLISKLTTKELELIVKDSSLTVKSNGNYKIPLVFDETGRELVNLPEITIGETTAEFDIKNDILQSIVYYNSKELQKDGARHPVQKMFYIDNEGCITFTAGACINEFTLEQPIKILLKPQVVGLFKLFKSDAVSFVLGFDTLSNGKVQQKVKFEDGNIKLTAIITNGEENYINVVPVAKIRGWGNSAFEHSVVLEKSLVLGAIDRLSLFAMGDNSLAATRMNFSFSEQGVTLTDYKSNSEYITYVNNTTCATPYTCALNIKSLKLTLDTCNEEFITLKFGTTQAVVVERLGVKNVIPESK